MKKETKELIKLPHNIEAEKSILGSLIIDNKLIPEVIDQIMPEDFYLEAHQETYKEIFELYNKNSPIDLITLAEKLKGAENVESPESFLTSLTSDLPTTANIKQYIKIVRDKASLRTLIKESHKAIDKAQGGGEAQDILAEATQKISKLSQERIKDGFPDPQELAKKFRDNFDYRIDNEINYRGLSSGFRDLDRYINGFGKGDLIVIGAVTKMGKTAFMLDIARRLCSLEEYKALFVTYEMSADQILARLISKMSDVDIWKITQSTANAKEIKAVHDAIAQYHDEHRIFINYAPGLDLFKLKNLIRRAKAKADVDIVFLDYLQLVPNVHKGRQRYEEVSGVARELKNLAGELGVVIIAAAQLDANLGQDNKPRINAIRESKAPEHESDALIFIHRESFFDPRVKHNRAEIIVKLTRHGKPGSFFLNFDERTVSFVEVPNEDI